MSEEVYLEDLYRLAKAWLLEARFVHMAGCQCHACRTARGIVREMEAQEKIRYAKEEEV